MQAPENLVPTSSDKHLQLVESLQTSAYLRSEHCVLAMQMVDRKDFVLPEIPQNVVYKVTHLIYGLGCCERLLHRENLILFRNNLVIHTIQFI